MDSACDQSMISSRSCIILSPTTIYFNVDGAMTGMSSNEPLQVMNVACLVTDPYSGSKLIAVINQALLINDIQHYESLLQPIQCCLFGKK